MTYRDAYVLVLLFLAYVQTVAAMAWIWGPLSLIAVSFVMLVVAVQIVLRFPEAETEAGR